MPVLGPVDHSSGNDNHLFMLAASLMDQSTLEPDSYRWSSATGQYHTVHAYSLKANSTLSKLCPYPVPPLYRLGMRVHRHCLASCAEELKASSLTCKPTPGAADNGRSPRLETCFDCCARDNCTDVCDKYPAHRCHMQLCSYGELVSVTVIFFRLISVC
ncbi:unnamed protein product [Trichobilharzia regenti]|nr:unnamed protein product [Trichobilharzia regenti]